jgi:hypothetical protein
MDKGWRIRLSGGRGPMVEAKSSRCRTGKGRTTYGTMPFSQNLSMVWSIGMNIFRHNG